MADVITLFAGMDIGDSHCDVLVVDEAGEYDAKFRCRTDEDAIRRYFSRKEKMRVVLEAGVHSHWVVEILEELGHEVRVLNPRDLAMIWHSTKKTDERDAMVMAELSRTNSQLAKPIQLRPKEQREDLVVLKARNAMVEARTKLLLSCRGMLKSFNVRLTSCSSETFHKLYTEVPKELVEALKPVFEAIKALTDKIRELDKQLACLCKKYPDTELLQTVCGVGPVVSLSFVLLVGDPYRFGCKRDVAAYFGLTMKRDQSGETDKQLGITKCGNVWMRSLLVQSAHHILGPYGKPSALRDWGLKLGEHGGKRAKGKAVVAVARKLSVIMLVMLRNKTEFVAYPGRKTETDTSKSEGLPRVELDVPVAEVKKRRAPRRKPASRTALDLAASI